MKIFLYLIAVLFIYSCALVAPDPILPEVDQYEDGLPILYIHPMPPSKETYTSIELTFKGKKYKAKGKVRGAGSVSYPKRNYSLKFDKDELFTFNDDIKNKRKVVLVSNFDDVSYVRTRLSYDLWNNMDNTFNVKSSSCVVYMNGKYHGLYTVVERIDDEFIDRHANEGIISKDGNLYKGTSRDSNFYKNSNDINLPLEGTDLAQGFEKKYGYPEAGNEGAYDDLDRLITDLNDFSILNFSSFFRKTFNIEDYMGWFSFTSYIYGSDSMQNNCYHYHDLATGKWHYIPWDFNVSFGQFTTISRTGNSSPLDFSDKNQVFNRISMDSELLEGYHNYNRLKLGGSYLYEEVVKLIDNIYKEVHDAAEKDSKHWKDERKEYYGTSGRNFTFEHEISYIKKWVKDQQLLWDSSY